MALARRQHLEQGLELAAGRARHAVDEPVSGTDPASASSAVGSTTNSSDGTQDGAIWNSTDGGHNWTLLPVGDLGGPGDQDIKRVTVLKSGITTGFVAVGTSTLNGDSDAAAWTSTDGKTWTRVPDPSNVLGGPGNQGMTDVQTFGTTLVAGGFVTGKDGTDGRGDLDVRQRDRLDARRRARRSVAPGTR